VIFEIGCLIDDSQGSDALATLVSWLSSKYDMSVELNHTKETLEEVSDEVGVVKGELTNSRNNNKDLRFIFYYVTFDNVF